MKLTPREISTIANSIGLDYATFMAFISVESGGTGFDPTTGKIIIQFEPTWFHRYLLKLGIPHKFGTELSETGKKEYFVEAKGIRFDNAVEGQSGEWEAFNKAFAIHPQAAMLSTSIGLMQIMGFHYALLGYKSVGEMWDTLKQSEYNQVAAGARFIRATVPLYKALLNRDWAKAAYYYNGEAYKTYSYDTKLANAWLKYSKVKL